MPGRCLADDAVERIFYNARISTAEPERPYAEAVAVHGDKIVAFGSRVDVEKMLGKQAERVPHFDFRLTIIEESSHHPCHRGRGERTLDQV